VDKGNNSFFEGPTDTSYKICNIKLKRSGALTVEKMSWSHDLQIPKINASLRE